MSKHVLLLTLGPIQDFIAAARRTRDLWFGSHLLSELSRAAARAVADGGGELIFPALDAGDDELEPCDAPLRPNGPVPLSVANKILALLPAAADPRDIARAARAAAQARLVELASAARANAAGLLAADIDALWDEQLATVLEYAASWAPLASAADYGTARRQVEQALAGRKNLREFAPWEKTRGANKSSLDGARESVLQRGRDRHARTVRRYRVAGNEELDAVGVLKRCGGAPEQFVPLRNVAVASWLAAADAHASQELEAVRAACRQTDDLPRVTRQLPCAKLFPFDADVLFADRWDAIRRELDLDEGLFADVQRAVRALTRKMGQPHPYVCCLAADGDHMGVALDQLTTPKAHRDFSRALAAFAPRARAIVEQDHLGVLVYAGGDDVLAFVPASTALDCAAALNAAFAEALASACAGPAPTLSVGLGIGHALTGMSDLLALARDAEKLAKHGPPGGPGGRNALAVLVQKRSGGLDSWTAPWPDKPVEALRRAVEQLGTVLPAGKVSEVRERLRRSPAVASTWAEPAWIPVLAAEVERIIGRAYGGDPDLAGGAAAPQPGAVGLTLDTRTYARLHASIDAWVNRMRLAMIFSEAEPTRRGEA